MTEHFDIIILGTGEAGIFAAYELAEKLPESRVLVLDRDLISIIVAVLLWLVR